MKLVILDGACAIGEELNFNKFAELGEVIAYPRTSPEEVVERIGDADCLYVNKVNITREIMEQCPNLRYIGVFATGYNVIDIQAAKELGIIVCNVPSYSTDSVAQLVFAFILELVSKVGAHSDSVHQENWTKCVDFSYSVAKITELKGKTLGIIGYGAIGKKVAEIAHAFGMKTLINNRTAFEGSVSKEEVYSNSDFVTLHCPLFKDNAKMIDKKALSLFKDGAYFINTARGGLVDEEALADALNSGKLAGAGLDVLSEEPPKDNNPLLTAKNCYITPHIAWATLEARIRLLDVCYDNLRLFLAGTPQNVVNK